MLRNLKRCIRKVVGYPEARPYATRGALDFLEAYRPDEPPAYTDDVRKGSVVIVLLYMSPGAGGLKYMVSLGRELARQHGVDVSYCTVGGQDHEHCWQILHGMDPALRREQLLTSISFQPEALMATTWATAFPVVRHPSRRKLYFVQDYEPVLYTSGPEQFFAERTYEMGLEMFTVGPWLAEFVPARHGPVRITPMRYPITDAGEPGLPLSQRKSVSVYFQPDKWHRGTDILVRAARRIGRELERRGLELVLFGSADNPYLKFDFPCRKLGVLTEVELAELFRDTRLGVSFSFTNASQLPFRFAAHGALALDLDLPCVRRNVPASLEPLVRYTAADPASVADAILRCVDENVADDARAGAVRTFCREHAWPACVAELGDRLWSASR